MLSVSAGAGAGAGAGWRGEVLDEVAEDLGELSIGASCAKPHHFGDGIFPTLLILRVSHDIARGMALAALPDKGVPSGTGREVGVWILMDLLLQRRLLR